MLLVSSVLLAKTIKDLDSTNADNGRISTCGFFKERDANCQCSSLREGLVSIYHPEI